jgi:hypothetical protein
MEKRWMISKNGGKMNWINVNGVKYTEFEIEQGLPFGARMANLGADVAKVISSAVRGRFDRESAYSALARIGAEGRRPEIDFAEIGQEFGEGIREARPYMKQEFGTRDGLKRNAKGFARKAALTAGVYLALC